MIERKWDSGRPEDTARGWVGPGFRQGFAAAFVLAFTAMPSAAFAASGETAGTVGAYQYPTPSGACGRLRNLQAKVDFTFACNANSTNCEFTSAGSGVQAPPLGFCQDALPNVRGVTLSAGDTLEKAKTLQATTFGVNTDITTAAGPVDIVSSTFAASSNRTGRNAAQGERASVQVLRTCPAGASCGPASCAGFNIKQDASACTDVASQLALSFTGNAASGVSISHAILFSAKQDVGKPGSQTVLVCPPFTWACGDPASADGGSGTTTVNSQVDYGILQTPGCAMTRSGYKCW